MSHPAPPDPERLINEGGEAARLLRRAEPEFRRGFDEGAAFRSVERTRRRRTALSWGLAASGLALGLFMVSGALERFRADPNRLALSQEVIPPAPPAASAVQAPALDPTPPSTPPAAAALAARPVTDDTPPSEPRCRSLVAAGKAERAVECFRALSRGPGLEAEVASYEAARLSADSLHDAARALRLLEEHARRFPEGALRGEAEWLRVQSLERTGRVEEALLASEALLATPAGRTLSSDLHWLRARIYDGRHDCERAASELVALVGEPGARGDKAEIQRAACLEKLGRAGEAVQAYQQYLRRAEPREIAQVRARLEALGVPDKACSNGGACLP